MMKFIIELVEEQPVSKQWSFILLMWLGICILLFLVFTLIVLVMTLIRNKINDNANKRKYKIKLKILNDYKLQTYDCRKMKQIQLANETMKECARALFILDNGEYYGNEQYAEPDWADGERAEEPVPEESGESTN